MEKRNHYILLDFWAREERGFLFFFFFKRKVHALITFLLFKKDKETA